MVASKVAVEESSPLSAAPPGPLSAVAVRPLPMWKRLFDIVTAGTVLIVATPVLLVVAAITLLVMGRPLLYRQTRGGLGGTTFEILKLRTMANAFDRNGVPLADDQRRHPWGDFLRRTSLDELPALVNIIRGEMSVVGPRPLMAKYLHRYDDHQAQRHSVTPGLTGLAQTKGRNKLDWAERFELDLEYANSMSLRTDLRILMDTVKIVLSREGADGNDHCTEFQGSQILELARRTADIVLPRRS